MDNLRQEVLKTLLYFDIFSFPLDLEEIHRFIAIKTSGERVFQEVEELLKAEVIQKNCCYFSVNEACTKGGKRAEKYYFSKGQMALAYRNAKLISKFPFVRGVAISGSLSKFSADEKADIDYFIITAPNRLWICRTLLHLFKKTTYLKGQQHDFCMNYFLAADELELKDKNIYTAIEATTIIPLFGKSFYQKFYHQNQWVKEWLPNQSNWFEPIPEHEIQSHWLKPIFELGGFGKWGDWWNQKIQGFTIWWWRRKFKKQGFPMQHFDNDLRATSGESKYHPFDYQRSILAKYQHQIDNFKAMELQ